MTGTFTSRITGVDYRVWLAMGLTCLLCLALLGYNRIRHSYANGHSCPFTSITVNGNSDDVTICNVNRIYLYRVAGISASNIEWDFGDGTPNQTGQVASHRFVSQGSYHVQAILDGHCAFEKEVLVKNEIVLPSENPVLEIFFDSLTVTVGGQVNFAASSNQPITSYAWSVLGTADETNKREASFIFNNPGEYIVQLVVNGGALRANTEKIKVVERPLTASELQNNANLMSGTDPNVPPNLFRPGENPFDQKSSQPGDNTAKPPTDTVKNVAVKPKATDINPESFKPLLQDVLNGNKNVDELYQYLDYRETTLVQVNDEKAMVKIGDFCREKQRRKIKSLEFRKDDKKGIQTVKVKLERTGLLHGIFH